MRKGSKMTPESIAKMSASKKGKPSWNKGKHFSDEARKNMSLAQTGRIPSDEHRKKQSESLRKFYKEHPGYLKNRPPMSEETRRKMSETMKIKAPWKGKKLSRETVAKMIATKKRIGIHKFYGPNHWNWKGGARYCEKCHKKIDSRAKLCMKCFHDFAWGEKANNWEGGWDRRLKEAIRKREGFKCALCGVPESQLTRKLHVHHIDYVKKNIAEDNLIALCQECHMKTNANRDYWTICLKEMTRCFIPITVS